VTLYVCRDDDKESLDEIFLEHLTLDGLKQEICSIYSVESESIEWIRKVDDSGNMVNIRQNRNVENVSNKQKIVVKLRTEPELYYFPLK